MSSDSKITESALGLRIGEIMLINGWITWEQLEKSLELQHQVHDGLHNLLVDKNKLPQKKGRAFHIGEILIQGKIISWEDLIEALKIQRQNGRKIGDILVEKGALTTKELHRALATQFNKTFADFKKITISPEVIKLVPSHMAKKHQIMPLIQKDNELLIAIADPNDVSPESDLMSFLPTFQIHIAVADPKEIREAIRHYYP